LKHSRVRHVSRAEMGLLWSTEETFSEWDARNNHIMSITGQTWVLTSSHHSRRWRTHARWCAGRNSTPHHSWWHTHHTRWRTSHHAWWWCHSHWGHAGTGTHWRSRSLSM